MQYQKYRNQGGTMSYQQFKMAVLQQAQGQGPMAQAANGGRIGYAFGKGPILDPDAQEGNISPFQIQQEEGVPMGLSASNAENESLLETLIEKFMDHPFNLPREGATQRALLELERMSQGGEEVIEEDVEYARDGGRIGYANGGMDDWYREYIARRNQEGAKYNPSRSEYEHYVNRPIPMGQAMPEGGLDEIRGQRHEQGPAIFATPTAQGGRIGAQEGGIMDLGGMEKDYRQEGGFVPLGEEEKADDVPARLSKNEFVFTADAVRAAGGGDIDAGAEVMENVMQNLEAGGQISEESQGGGGEETISEEELIEAPNGAQEMYDNMKQLETRIA
jgi:hypothetical protein